MSRLLKLCSILLPLLSAVPAGAQQPAGVSGVISGIVQSGDGAPAPSASIVLRRSADLPLVAATSTDSTGAFRIGGVAPGSYVVQVRRLGHRMVTRTGVTLTASVNRVDLGIIRLVPIATALQSVVVSAARPAITILPDRSVYSTSGMPVAAGGTATDVLRSIPELEVSVEGSVTSRGATPQIHINGRPAPMQGEALDRYLQQLPAERIDRIEVISNPSAKYEAEGQGGIVNIVMKRGTSLGLSGSAAVNAGTRNQRGGSGSINFQEGRLSLFGSASASFFGNRSENSDLRENLSAQPATFIQQDSRDRNSGGAGDVSLAAELRAGPRGTLWADVGAGRNTSDLKARTAYAHLDDLRNPTRRYDRANDTDLRGMFGSSAVGYRNVADSGGGEWSLELRQNFNGDDHASESTRYWFQPDGSPLAETPELTFADQGQDQSDLTLQADVTRGWGETGRVEAGYRGSLRNTVDDSRISVDASGDAGADDAALGEFRQRERIHAGFVSASRQIGRFHVQAGLRGERAEMRRTLPFTREVFESNYRNLFPSANISTQLGAGQQLTVAYSKRVDRPRAGILNPAIPILDPLNRRIGNPHLMPRYTHSFSLTMIRTGRLGLLQLSPYYRRTVNNWDQVRTVDEAGISTVTWQNLATISSYGASLTASLTPLGRVGGFLSVSGYREVRDGSNLRKDFSGSSTHFSVINSASIRATSALSLQTSLTYLPARSLPQGRISSMVFSTLGVRQQLWGRRGAINLSVTDPFELQRFRFTTRDRTHVQIGSSSFSTRSATLGISYTFGRPPQRKDRSDAEEGQQEKQAPIIR